eukprot:gene6041-7525_t
MIQRGNSLSSLPTVQSININNNNNPLNASSDDITRYTPPNSLNNNNNNNSNIRVSRYKEDFSEIEKVGKGGYGSVYKVQNKLDGLYYALKKITFKNSTQTFLEKVLREVKTLASLNHPNIVRYHSAWLETETCTPSLNGNNGLKTSQQQQQQHLIDGNWGTSDLDPSTIVSDEVGDNCQQQQQKKNKYNRRRRIQQQQKQDDSEDDEDDSLNKLQFPPELEEELKMLGRKSLKESQKYFDDSDDDSQEVSSNGFGFFKTPKKHYTSFSLDDDTDDNDSDSSTNYDSDSSVNDSDSFQQSESESDSDCSDDDSVDEDEFTSDHHLNIDLIPNPKKISTKPTTPPISILYRITTLFIVMQLYSQTLSQWLENRAPDQINPEENLKIFKQICVGLRYIHSKGIIHRDLKPGNVFLVLSEDHHNFNGLSYSYNSNEDSQPDEDLLVSLGDFGLAVQHNISSTSPTPSPTPTSTPSLTPVNSQIFLQSISNISPLDNISIMSSSVPASIAMQTSQHQPILAPLTPHSSSSNNQTTTSTAQSPAASSSTMIHHPQPSSSHSSSTTTPSSSLSRSSEHCKHTSAVGTLTYSSPEQKKGLYNEKTDIYSLGIILFELYFPFSTRMEKARVLSDLRNGILPKSFSNKHPKISNLILSMMKTNPDERPSASDILKSDIFGTVLSVPEMESIIKQQQNIIEQLKQEIFQLKSPSSLSNILSDAHSIFKPGNDHFLIAE